MADHESLARIAPDGPIALSWRQRLGLIARAAVGSMDVAPGSLGYTILSKINLGGLGLPPRRGTPQLLQAYGEMPWLRAVTSRVADAFAVVEWRLFYAKQPDQLRAYRHVRAQKAAFRDRIKIRKQLEESEQLHEITQHPLLDAMESVNEFHTGYQMRRLTCTYVDLVGDAFWAKERNGAGLPVAFWPIPPSWILSTATPQFPYYRISYRGWQDRLRDTDVLWFQDPDPLNPYGRGSGVGQSLGDELESDEYAARTTKQAFFNRALPEILVMAEGLSEPDTRRLEYDWLAKNQGFFRGFKPMFLNRKVEVEQFPFDFRQMQFVQLRQFERDTIMQTFGIPPEIMGVLEHSNRSTIDAADYVFTSKVVQPRCEFFRNIMQARLVPEYDDRLILDYEDPVIEDRDFNQKAMAAVPGAYRVDEHRALTGHDALENDEGKVFFVPALMTVKAKLEEAPAAPAPSPFGQPTPTPGPAQPPKPGQPPPASEPKPPVAPQPPKMVTNGWHRTKRATKSAYEDAAARIADRLEPAMRQAFLNAVAAVRGKVDMDALARAVERNDVHAVNAALQVEQFANQLQGARQVVGDAFVAGGTEATGLLADVGIALSFRMNSPTALGWVRDRGANLVTQVTTETREAIRAAIEDAFLNGRPPREVARSLLDVIGLTTRQTDAVDRFRTDLEAQGVSEALVDRRVGRYAASQLRRRAQNIARTEIAAASNGGTQEAWTQARDAGLLDAETARRVWIVTHDDRLDLKQCEPMDEQERGLDEPFVTGEGERVMAPPVHPQCLPAGALISPGPKITGQTVRMYEGDLCVLRTASGQRLAVTPNHPILTPAGWLPAKLAYEAGYVVRRLRGYGEPLPDADHHDAPARIEKISQAIRRSGRFAAAAVPTTREDFHGDGLDGHVAVVRADRLLRRDEKAATAESRDERHLIFAAGAPQAFVDAGAIQQLDRRPAFAARASMGRRQPREPFSRVHTAPLHEFRFRPAARNNVRFEQAPPDDLTAHTKLAGELLLGGAGQIAFDKILHVEVVPFHGLVYNLQTVGGWYIAEGIITHNCRCTIGLMVRQPEEATA